MPQSIGGSTKEFFDYQYYYYYEESTAILRIYKTQLPEDKATPSGLYAEWTLNPISESSSWTHVAIDSVSESDADRWMISIQKPSEETIDFRIRLADDNSGNWYYFNLD